MTNTFNVGDRVRYIGNETQGLKGITGTVIAKTATGSHPTASNVPVQWDKPLSGSLNNQMGVFPSNIELLQTGPQKGDRVRVTLTGTLQHTGQYASVLIDGCTSTNIIDSQAEGVQIEVLEPEWGLGDVVRDADGVYFNRAYNGWWRFGYSQHFSDKAPRRPLTKIS